MDRTIEEMTAELQECLKDLQAMREKAAKRKTMAGYNSAMEGSDGLHRRISRLEKRIADAGK
jgi:hypothetical protein